MSKLKLWTLASLLLPLLSLHGIENCCNQYIELELDSGYRWDRIDHTTKISDTALTIPGSSTQRQFKGMSSYQIGARGISDYCDFLVKATGYYGYILGGDFYSDQVEHGKTKGHTISGSCAVGYNYSVNCCLDIVPLAGISYDRQLLKIRHTRSFNAAFPSPFSHQHWHAKWYGPWAGIDFIFDTCGHAFTFKGGYEFHIGIAHAGFRANHPAGSYAFHTMFHYAMGHVFTLDGNYDLCNGWVTGFHVKYTYWGNGYAKKTSFSDSSVSDLTASQRERTTQLSWHSCLVTLNLGMSF